MEATRVAGKYRIVDRIADGGMGEVYRAQLESPGMAPFGGVAKTVALKLLRSNLAQDAEFAALFVEEVRVAMNLSHANIVQAFDVGRIDQRWFLAMEYVEGVDLAALIRACRQRLGQPIPRRHALLIAVEALKGLDYAHRRRGKDGASLHIVHRDVSPGNVLVSVEGEVKVVDFGIAKSALRAFASMAGTVKGKLPYMAPEQLRGQPVDRRADLYSVGAVLYEMLTGQRLVDDAKGTAAIPAVLAGDWPRPRALTASIPDELEGIVLRALQADPRNRYPNAAAMRQELERFAMSQSFLLSSADLADFLAEAGSVERRPTTLPPAPGQPRTPTPVLDLKQADTHDGPHAGFDAFLGRELEQIESDEPFSVFTTGLGGKRLAAPTGPEPAATQAPTLEDGGRSTRRRKIGWVVGTALLAAVVAGTLLALRPRHPPDSAAREVPPPTELTTAPTERRGPAPERPRRAEAHTPAAAGPPSPAPKSSRPPRRTRRVRARSARRQPAAHPSAGREPPSAPPPVRAEKTAGARLSVNTDPWSYVWVDDTRLGATPQIATKVTAGPHRLRFHNPSANLERILVVRLQEGEHRRVSLKLTP